MSQIITVTFAEGQREAIAAQPLEQWAYGQTLQFEGLELPQAYRVDFSNFEYCGASIPRVGGPDGVAVPVEVLTSGLNVYAFIWVQDETSGARYRRATVRVVPGPEPDTDESPEEQSAVTEAINALNAAAAAIPEQVDAAVEEAVSSGTFADVFWIEYGLTTADEIYAANAAGKVCLMKPTQGKLFYLTWCGEARNLGPGGVTLEKKAFLTAWDGDEKTTIDVMHETWSAPSTVKFARTASPTFTGTPKAPTANAGTNSTQIATTAFVAAAIQAALEGFTPGQTISEELKRALLQLARKVAYIDAQGETYYQDLYDALYPPAVLASIQATFAQGSTVIYNTDSLDVLKPLLTVTAVYDDGSTETVPAADYTLSGTLATGISTITASYQGKTATFQVTVTAAPMAFPVTNNLTSCSTSNSAAAVMENEPYSAVITPTAGYTLTGASVVITMAGSNITASAYSNGVINIARVTGALVISIVAQQIILSSISASYTQSGVVYNTDTLDSLKADLVVTAAYSDGTSTVLAADAYTLSGTLTAGTSTITVSYGGKSTTFQVQVTAAPQVYLVTNELTGCTTDNSAASVVEGSAYAARITASTGYTLVGAVVTITMGGQDITASAYSGGVISIPAVTGALVISVAAVAVVLSSISAVYANASANVPVSASQKKLAYIDADGSWKASNDSFSLAIPVTTGKAYKLALSETSSSLVGDRFRWAFCNSDTPSGQILSAWNSGWTPQNCQEVTVKAVDDYLIIQLQGAYGDSIVSNGYLTITEYDNCIQDLGTLDPLTSNLVVTATYTGGATEIIPSTDYTLSGSLNTGENTITVTYGGKTDTFTAIVAAPLFSIPDFSATTQGSLTISKTSGVYSVSGAGTGVIYIKPDGSVATSKSNTAWFSTPSGASLSNYIYGADWSNPLTSDTNLAVKFSQASATGNRFTANVAMAASSSGTNASAEFALASLSGGVNISSLGLQFYPRSGSGSPSATFKFRLVVDGVRYL